MISDETQQLLQITTSASVNETPSQSYGSIRFAQSVEPVTISWHNLVVTHKKTGRAILDNVSGIAEPGQLVALMGASGAGKTTLLNTLIARNLGSLRVQGKVLVNGHELRESITYVSGYVQQEELFMGTLTVHEHLMVQARLRLHGANEKTLRRRVNELIEELGLEKCRNAYIGLGGIKKGISGGEARRLAFAGELLNNPQIVFADEPTTGLDSSMADSVINLMRRLTEAGRTVICTIHQLSSAIFRKFDKVMFLAAGRLAYFGEPEKAVELLERFSYPCPRNWNPADSVIERLSVNMHDEDSHRRILDITDQWDRSPEGAEFYRRVENQRSHKRERPKRRTTTSVFVQTFALLHRSLLDNWRNPNLTRAKLVQKMIMGLFIGFLYFQTNPNDVHGIGNLSGAMFYIVAELTYSTLFGILMFMPADYPLFLREYHDGLYCSGAYYIARAASYFPLFALDGILLVSISYWMIGLAPTVARFLVALGIAVLIEQSVASFGIMLSCVSPSFPVAVSVAGPILTVLSLTGGLYANVGQLPKFIKWIQYLSWFRYGFESMAIAQWEGVLSAEEAHSVLRRFSFHSERFATDLIAMCIFIIIYYTIGFCGLLIRAKRSR